MGIVGNKRFGGGDGGPFGRTLRFAGRKYHWVWGKRGRNESIQNDKKESSQTQHRPQGIRRGMCLLDLGGRRGKTDIAELEQQTQTAWKRGERGRRKKQFDVSAPVEFSRELHSGCFGKMGGLLRRKKTKRTSTPSSKSGKQKKTVRKKKEAGSRVRGMLGSQRPSN